MLMMAWKLAPALATGNTVLIKPAEQTPLSALRIGELILEAGFPDGVVNVLPGSVSPPARPLPATWTWTKWHSPAPRASGASGYGSRRKVQFEKPVTLELGGKSPNIIFADVDLDEAVEGAHMGLFANQGQSCCAGSRVFVDKTVYDQFVEKSIARREKRVVGDPFDPATELVPW